MLISEIIKELTEIKDQHGDLPCYHWDDWEFFSIDNIKCFAASDEDYAQDFVGLGGDPIDLHGSSERIKSFYELKENSNG